MQDVAELETINFTDQEGVRFGIPWLVGGDDDRA